MPIKGSPVSGKKINSAVPSRVRVRGSMRSLKSLRASPGSGPSDPGSVKLSVDAISEVRPAQAHSPEFAVNGLN
jgi:hypothetical protein